MSCMKARSLALAERLNKALRQEDFHEKKEKEKDTLDVGTEPNIGPQRRRSIGILQQVCVCQLQGPYHSVHRM